MSERTDRAVSYGITGATVGSAAGPWGTAIGGAAGAGYGYLTGGGGAEGMDRAKAAEQRYGNVDRGNFGIAGYDDMHEQYNGMGRDFAARDPRFSGYRGHQKDLGRVLAQEAQGNGVGQRLVGMQARQAANRASAQQFGAIAGARPGMQAMASRNAMLGTAMAQSAVGEQAAMGSAHMTLGAQQQYGNFLQGARGQDESNILQTRQMNDNAQLEAYRQRLSMAQSHQQGAISAEQQRTQRYAALLGVPTQGEINAGMIQGGLSAYGAMRGHGGGGTTAAPAAGSATYGNNLIPPEY